MAKHIFWATAFLFFANAAYGCSIAKGVIDEPEKYLLIGKSLYKKEVPKPTYYIFIGEVVGIVRATKEEIGKNKADAAGVKIKVTDNVYTPQSATYYEVFPLHINPDCSLRGSTGIERSYPIGSQVRVIANEAEVYKKQSTEDSIIRLETSYMTDTSIVQNNLEFHTTANAFFKYKDIAPTVPTEPKTEKEWNIYYSKQSLVQFELQKDLTRLALSKSKTERLEVLQRLVDYPYLWGVAYRTLLHTYLKPGKELETLEKKWLDRLQEAKSKIKVIK